MARYRSVTSGSTLHFVALVVFACLVMASVLWFVLSADMNHRVMYTASTDDFRESAPFRGYEGLTDRQQRIFHEAVEDGRYVADEPFDFPEAVRRDGTYYQFRYSTAFDWADAATYRPALAWLVGMAGVVAVLRRDVR